MKSENVPEIVKEAIDNSTDYEKKLIALGWPAALAKAAQDCPFDYVALVSGIGWIRFQGADLAGEGWVRLYLPEFLSARYERPSPNEFYQITGEPWAAKLPYCFERGLEIRLSDIRLVADAPNGS